MISRKIILSCLMLTAMGSAKALVGVIPAINLELTPMGITKLALKSTLTASWNLGWRLVGSGATLHYTVLGVSNLMSELSRARQKFPQLRTHAEEEEIKKDEERKNRLRHTEMAMLFNKEAATLSSLYDHIDETESAANRLFVSAEKREQLQKSASLLRTRAADQEKYVVRLANASRILEERLAGS